MLVDHRASADRVLIGAMIVWQRVIGEMSWADRFDQAILRRLSDRNPGEFVSWALVEGITAKALDVRDGANVHRVVSIRKEFNGTNLAFGPRDRSR